MTDDAASDVHPRDVLLAYDLSEAAAAQFLRTRGFRNPEAADRHLQHLAEDLPTRLALGELAESLFEHLGAAPDPDAALVGFCRYMATRTPKSSFLGYLLDDPRSLQVLAMLLGSSPFLSEILIRSPEYFHWLQGELDRSPPDHIAYGRELDRLLSEDSRDTRRRDALNRFQRREILRIAGRDLLGTDTLRSTTEQLSNLADAMASGALRVAMAELRTEDPLPGAFTVIGMGKLGGRELNYSSDIDLVYVYEPTEPEDGTAHNRFQKLGRRLTALLGEHTAEGYLYRVDLRLRPMGPRGSLALSLAQCAQYYESMGETFERFALIKARPVAGDAALGQRFVEMVRPFVYRKYLDHAAIEELARYKARADREHARHEATERNVKVGRGGIREIELFTQVFQLIYGADVVDLQDGNTLSALAALERHGFVDEAVRVDMQTAYEFLRKVEHRLQIVQETQTHSLKDSDAELRILARRTGLDTTARLMAELDRHRGRVHDVYASLLDRRGDDTGFQARQFFRVLAGEMSKTDAIDHLRAGGISDADAVFRAIRALDDVPSHAHSPSATRNLLANLLASVLPDLASGVTSATALMRLETIVDRSGAAAALYRSLLESDDLRVRLLIVLDAGDLFAERLARFPELLDSLVVPPLDPDAFGAAVRRAFAELAAPDTTLEALRDPFRRIKMIEEFKALAEWLSVGHLDRLTNKLSVIADAAVNTAAREVADERLPDTGDGAWVVLALGKLGGRELTVHSDLDLVFLYRGDPGDAAQFERQQRFVRALHEFLDARTSFGSAYQLDARLRPEGEKGAITVPLVTFRRYLDERAEIWERMAWTRCRVVAGDAALAEEVGAAVNDFVYATWTSEIPAYARHMRSRVERELSREAESGRHDLKRGLGGLADIDFLVQTLQLREGPARTEFRGAGTRQLLRAWPDTSFVDRADADALCDAHLFLRTLETAVRIEANTSVSSITNNPADLDPVANRLPIEPATGSALLQRYREITGRVRQIYENGMKRLEE